MPEVYTEFQLKPYNTFAIRSVASYFVICRNIGETRFFLRDRFFGSLRHEILGGGSNMLFTNDFDGLIIKPDYKGIEVIDEDRNHVYVRAGAGEEWDNLVDFAVSHGWGGLENLSIIPGTVGASPIQNIGAYGVEAKDTISSVEALDLDNYDVIRFNNEECHFGYRSSIFKQNLKGKILVTYVTYRLDKRPKFLLDYGNLKEEVAKISAEPTLQAIRQAVITIRESKLPDPKEFGNAGSFFKNPIVSKRYAEKLAAEYTTMPSFEVNANEIKIPAAWLLEKADLKGYREGEVGTHPKQPLVIINYGNAKGKEIVEFAHQIIEKVHLKFGIMLEPEVNIID
jgi:UDP-N-acetylmuramate dehydrogenase